MKMTFSRRLVLVFVIYHGSSYKENKIQIFSNSYFLYIYAFWHLLESPHRGDSNGMPQCMVYSDGIETPQCISLFGRYGNYLKDSPSTPFYPNLCYTVRI